LRCGTRILSTEGAELLRETTAEPVGAEITARLLPARDKNGTRTLLIPFVRRLCRRHAGSRAGPTARWTTRACSSRELRAPARRRLSTVSAATRRSACLLEERSAIARELHDSLAQSLAYMKSRWHGCSTAWMLCAVRGAAATAQELRDGLNGAYREVRELISAFARRSAAAASPHAAGLANEFSQRNDLVVSLDNSWPAAASESTRSSTCCRSCARRSPYGPACRRQESPRGLSYGQDHRVRVVIEDDGRGLSALQLDDKHYGLSIMRERANSLGGELVFEPGRRRNAGLGHVCARPVTPEPAARGDG